MRWRYPLDHAGDRAEKLLMQVLPAIGFIAVHALVAAAMMSPNPDLFFGMPINPIPDATRLMSSNSHLGVIQCACIFAFAHMAIYFEHFQAEPLARADKWSQI